MIFPFKERPSADYHVRPRAFGSPRGATPQSPGGTRKHAGCDLYAEPGTEILAVEDGVVTCAIYPFYDVVFAIEVRHPSGIVRYGEISHCAPGIAAGSQVKAGQVIAYVGKMKTVPQAMLHFEMYGGTGKGPLTDRTRAPFMRREDLVNPTAFLDGPPAKAESSPALAA
jgi:murein DD-endopeptidase MepM/ murein hydrolase activator NlpD